MSSAGLHTHPKFHMNHRLERMNANFNGGPAQNGDCWTAPVRAVAGSKGGSGGLAACLVSAQVGLRCGYGRSRQQEASQNDARAEDPGGAAHCRIRETRAVKRDRGLGGPFLKHP